MYVLTGDRQLFMTFANLYNVHARRTGSPISLRMGKPDVCGYTFQFCNEAVNILTTGITIPDILQHFFH
jgi:hypothetical protein